MSYAAMRLGRTELNNAFHTTTRNHWAATPFVPYMKWSLSGSHPRPDICNGYAEDTHVRNGEAGVFDANEVPDKPHPQCLCYVSPVTMDDDEFVQQFHAGRFDSWVDQQLKSAD
jgi:hypothetical protein